MKIVNKNKINSDQISVHIMSFFSLITPKEHQMFNSFYKQKLPVKRPMLHNFDMSFGKLLQLFVSLKQKNLLQLKMHNQQEVIEAQAPPRSVTIQEDPFEKSFEDSAIQYFPYRIFLIICALGLLQLGKTSLPQDAVPCIEDVVNTALQPIADFFIQTPGFGLTLMTIMQLICDIQLVGMVIYWVIWGNSFTYPLAVGVLAISKILINILFKTHQMQNAFKDRVFVSLMFGENFENTYFFSGITAFLTINLLEFYYQGYRKLFLAQIPIMIYVLFLLMAMRLNFFMDVVTALAFGYIVYSLLACKKDPIDGFLLNPRQKIKQWVNKSKDQTSSATTNNN